VDPQTPDTAQSGQFKPVHTPHPDASQAAAIGLRRLNPRKDHTMLTEQIAFEPHTVAPEFLARILSPYQPTQTDYLKEARIVQQCELGESGEDESENDGAQTQTPIVTAVGYYSIPNSCYIQSTGHFNAVEYLICFNQLAYTTFGYLIAERVLAELPSSRASSACRSELQKLTIDRFFSKQLSSMLILKTETRFTKVIDASDFRAELAVNSVFYRKGTLFTQTTCRFTDKQGGSSDGTVLLAYPLNFA
jgi:FcoT-like thioesterase domain